LISNHFTNSLGLESKEKHKKKKKKLNIRLPQKFANQLKKNSIVEKKKLVLNQIRKLDHIF
jgi:hypothetical protein